MVNLKTLHPECSLPDHLQCKNYYYDSDPLMCPSYSDWLHRFSSGEKDHNLLSTSPKTASKWHTETITVWAAAMWQLAFLDPEDEGTTLLWNMSYYTPDWHSVTLTPNSVISLTTHQTVSHPKELNTWHSATPLGTTQLTQCHILQDFNILLITSIFSLVIRQVLKINISIYVNVRCWKQKMGPINPAAPTEHYTPTLTSCNGLHKLTCNLLHTDTS
jgi:hypothetical protein